MASVASALAVPAACTPAGNSAGRRHHKCQARAPGCRPSRVTVRASGGLPMPGLGVEGENPMDTLRAAAVALVEAHVRDGDKVGVGEGRASGPPPFTCQHLFFTVGL